MLLITISKTFAACTLHCAVNIDAIASFLAGTHASGSKTCEYSTKDDGGSKQGKAETAAGATEAAYQCACIKEADKPKAEWKEMLTCPAGYSPLDSDINMCRVIVDGERASIGWIQTGKLRLSASKVLRSAS